MLARESRLIGSGSPFELEDAVIGGVSYRTYRHGPKTLNDLYRRAARTASREFLVQGECRLSNMAILRQAAALGRVLKESFHIHSEMRIGLSLDNRPEWLTAFVAITSIGATAVALPAYADPIETVAALELTDCAVVIASRTAASRLTECGYRGSTIALKEDSLGHDGLAFPFHLHASGAIATHYALNIDPEQLALIAFTSGSTGRSKGVLINHRSLMQGMMNMLLGAALSAGSPGSRDRASGIATTPVSLLTAQFSHIGGYSHLLLMLYLGGTVIVLPEWNLSAAIALIKREAVTSIAGATSAMIRDLIGDTRASGATDSLRSIGIHGVSLLPRLLSEIAFHLPQVTVSTGYGMTETNGTMCAIAGTELTQRPTSSGRPLPTVDIRITHSAIAKEEPAGEILVRGAMLMQGYCSDSVDPAGSSAATEWFATGDFGHIDADGFVHVTDRADHIITCNGHRVSCGTVEKSLLDTGLVKDVAVFGGPEFHQGNRLVVIAVPKEGKPPKEQAILERLNAVTHADTFAPDIVWATALPHTRSGKVDRHQLRQHLLDQRTGQFQKD